MTFLKLISRFVIGFLFLFSGYVKLIDPVGGGLIIGEYFKIVGIVGWSWLYPIISITLSIAEMLIGTALLVRLRVKNASILAFYLFLFFTLVTLYLLIFDPIADCGCFGEAIKLSNLQSFVKNILLLPFVILLFIMRDKIKPATNIKLERYLLLFFLVIYGSLAIYSYRNLPLIDFMEYKTGTSLVAELSEEEKSDDPRFETILIYTKGGKEYQFTLDQIPDSTYTFVDSKSYEINKGSQLTTNKFAVSEFDGEYITDSLLSIKGPLFVLSTPFAHSMSKRAIKRAANVYNTLSNANIPILFLSGSSKEESERLIKGDKLAIPLYHADFKTLFSLNRSFGGVTYINNGSIIAKWSSTGFPINKIDSIIKEDPELIAAKRSIKERLSFEILTMALVIIIALVRFSIGVINKQCYDKNR